MSENSVSFTLKMLCIVFNANIINTSCCDLCVTVWPLNFFLLTYVLKSPRVVGSLDCKKALPFFPMTLLKLLDSKK